MTRRKVTLAIFLILLVISITAYFSTQKNNNQQTQKNKISQSTTAGQIKSASLDQNINDNSSAVLVTRIIDGDTIVIEGGQKVRYIGINTPETVHPTKPVECYGHEASNKNRELVEGKKVILEKDVSETDKYGRLLRYVYLPSGQTDESDIFVNDYLVKEGYANSSSFPPDVKYQDKFVNSEKEARGNNRGLWAACSQDSNSQSSFVHQTTNNQPNSDSCLIKGNISSSGEKIYHMPGQRYYNQTVIDESKGEKWFCTEDDAISAGFRKSKI